MECYVLRDLRVVKEIVGKEGELSLSLVSSTQNVNNAKGKRYEQPD